MLKQKLKDFLASQKHLADHQSLKIFGSLIHNPHLWHLNRSSGARALSVGLFCAWLPLPMQMVFAAAGAILFRANLLLSISLVWLSNPITTPAMALFAYTVGAYILNLPKQPFTFEPSFAWFMNTLGHIWQPFLLGSLVCAIVSAIMANIIFRLIWRFFILRDWHARKNGKK